MLLTDDALKIVLNRTRLRQRGIEPKLSDAEIITIELVGEFIGIDTDKGIWYYFQEHWLKWFPYLGSRVNFVKQASNLCWVKQKIQQMLAKQLGGFDDEYIWQMVFQCRYVNLNELILAVFLEDLLVMVFVRQKGKHITDLKEMF